MCILLIFSRLRVNKFLIDKYGMYNLYEIFARFLSICKQVAGNLVNESGNLPRRGVVPRFSDLEIVALNMTSLPVLTVSLCCLQSYRNTGLKFPILYPVDNTMTDVKSLRPYVMQSGKEWPQKWMAAKIISALIRSR